MLEMQSWAALVSHFRFSHTKLRMCRSQVSEYPSKVAMYLVEVSLYTWMYRCTVSRVAKYLFTIETPTPLPTSPTRSNEACLSLLYVICNITCVPCRGPSCNDSELYENQLAIERRLRDPRIDQIG